SVYLTGTGSRDYLDGEMFESAGIELRWQEFEHPSYPQLHGPFEPMLSVLDYLMMAERTIFGTTEAALGGPVDEPARIDGQRV
ncbi:MAG: WbqC family protein, partial [Deltaproteobacteria bacterium]|nr:WbqC family protein [Deltaproteobacteria bacterium]